MISSKWLRRLCLPGFVASACLVSAVMAQQPQDTATVPLGTGRLGAPAGQPVGQQPIAQSPYRVAERLDPAQPQTPGSMPAAQPNEHPLMPALNWAKQELPRIEAIQDYSATVVKRERIDGKLGNHEYMFIKVRHKPFSVYMYFLGPPALKGQEVIYVEGLNDGKMWAHTVGLQDTLVGTVSLSPTGFIAMRGQRYPITELGVLTLIRRLVQIGERDSKYGECDVQFIDGAKINERNCTCIQVIHPVPRSNFLFHIARIFVDNEYNAPVRYESHDWPKEEDGQPELIEEYTYLDMKFNNGFTNADFDTRNPNYKFR